MYHFVNYSRNKNKPYMKSGLTEMSHREKPKTERTDLVFGTGSQLTGEKS